MKFVWDEKKRKKVIRKRQIDFELIQDIFDDPYLISFRDEKHSTKDELRWNVISMTAHYGLICLTFTELDNGDVKFITAWKAEKWMQNEYKNQ